MADNPVEQMARELPGQAYLAGVESQRAEVERLQAKLARYEKTLQEVRKEVELNMDCHHPAHDGSDDCGDINDCRMHFILAILDAAKEAIATPSAGEPGKGGK